MNDLINLESISFASLFIWLLFDTKKDSKEREQKYQKTIENLSKNIEIVNDIKEDVKEIKGYIGGIHNVK